MTILCPLQADILILKKYIDDETLIRIAQTG